MKRIFAFLIVAVTALTSCSFRDYAVEPVYGVRDDLFGTTLSIVVYEKTRDSVINAAFERAEEIHEKMAISNPSSEINALNASNGEWVTLSEETAALVARAREYSAISGGAFDITVEPVIRLWGISGKNPRVPDEDEISAAIATIGYKKIEVDAESGAVNLGMGMSADMGAIAKGYACGVAADVLRNNDVKRAILDFGGNIYALGEKEGGLPWRVGVRNPIIGESGNIGVVMVKDKAVVTSGGYERYFSEKGEIWHHIIDPATGYPADSGVLSVTVICEDSAAADALSTATFVMGTDKGLELLNSIDGVEGIFVCDDFTVRMTDGAADIFSLTDERFDFVEEE